MESDRQIGTGLTPTEVQVALGYIGLETNAAITREVLGHNLSYVEYVVDRGDFDRVFSGIIREQSQLGNFISSGEMEQVAQLHPDGSEAQNMSVSMANRWNQTLTGWNSGSLEADGLGQNRVSYSKLRELLLKSHGIKGLFVLILM